MGCVRTNNEDNFAYDPANSLYVVCDGMGGMAAGEVASSIACNTVIDVYAGQPAETPALTRLSLAIRTANHAVRTSSAQNPEQHGMGTTLVAAVMEGSKLIIGNVGDSRAYLMQNGSCMQVTVDHSYINELVRNGTVKVEDIHSVNLKGLESVITRAIGAADEVDPDFFAIDLRENDTVLLSSDGLTRYVDSSRLAELIDPSNLDVSCQRLIQAAKDGGGADNITVLLLRFNATVAGGESVGFQPMHTSVEEAPEPEAVAAVEPDSAEQYLTEELIEQQVRMPADLGELEADPAPEPSAVAEPQVLAASAEEAPAVAAPVAPPPAAEASDFEELLAAEASPELADAPVELNSSTPPSVGDGSARLVTQRTQE
jgi:protein phosphatase